MPPRRYIERALLLIGGLLLAVHHGPVRAQGAATSSQAALSSTAPVSSSSYRSSAAHHIYATYAASIYKGTLPPLVHAIVVIDTEVDARGNVRDVRVVRTPSHAPEVTQEVERMIRGASPFPVPGGADRARFTEVWLVDHSGRFQLHTLTEGQRDE